MLNVLLVGAGGFVGSVGRYLLSGWVQNSVRQAWLPYGTLAVNVVGCLLIGWISGLAENREVFRPETRVLLLIGVLGGFTTFSTFGYETFHLARDGEWVKAAGNVTAQVVLGFLAVWAGHALSRFM
ncbi:MAG: putative fluoride ion transporter CrcB [Candidatus Hydrogenedentota bacterium]